jgi:hypothetical protein
MTVKTIESRHEGLTVFDVETGELLYYKKPKAVKVTSFDKYVGIDTKYPYECVTKDSLIECLSIMDGYIKDEPYLTSHNLVDALNQSLMTPLEMRLITHVVMNLAGWNIYIGTVKDLCSCGITEANISRLIKGLEPNGVRVKSRNKPYRGDIVLEVSPHYGWKGDIRYREMRMNSWYGGEMSLD